MAVPPPLAGAPLAHLPPGVPPRLLVVVDTEEEFDWNAPFDRRHTSVEAMRAIDRGQELFESLGLRPTYVVDYPVATQEAGFERLAGLRAEGRCLVGAHLHPWVTPPHEERVEPRNSYPGNLPPALERAKLEVLTDAIERNLGERPFVYKAGRYGLGPATPATLAALGYRVDLSPCAGFDLSADGGPDWSEVDARPRWLGPPGGLLTLPTSGGFAGLLGRRGALWHRLAHRSPWRALRVPGILSRLGLCERLLLSPEGYRPEHARRLARALLSRGTRVLTLSLHSPSLAPGHTPYVRDAADLQRFLADCRRMVELLVGEFGLIPTDPLAVHDELRVAASCA